MRNTQIKLLIHPSLLVPMRADAKSRDVTVQHVALELLCERYGVAFVAPKRGGDQRSKAAKKRRRKSS